MYKRQVLGFLDLAGDWDPSLALVMGGAIMVGVFAFAVAKLSLIHISAPTRPS